MEIIEEIRKYVESECKKSTSKYGYEPYNGHFVPVVKYSKILAKEKNADMEIVEISAWLHDIGSIIYGREDHHITGAEIAEKKLVELKYNKDKIEKVKHCIISHRGSKEIKRESVEAEILADADSMSHFDNIGGIYMAAFLYENLNQTDANKCVKNKLINSFNKLSSEAKTIIKPKFEAAMLLLEE
jgi:putative nucleotidyltransferase with HDIG domain